MTAPVRLDVASGIATVTLDAGTRRNVLSVEMLELLHGLLARAAATTGVRVVVLTHTGPVFCAGADLDGDPATLQRALADVLTAVPDLPVPVVGRIEGHAVGGGAGLVAACDVSVASSEARFGFPEVRLGLAPALVAAAGLAKLRRTDAYELFLTGDVVTAERAVACGLVTHAVPRAALDERVAQVCRSLVAGGPGALRATKRLLAGLPHLDPAQGFAWATQLSAEVAGSDEAAAGRAAYRARQPAPWTTA